MAPPPTAAPSTTGTSNKEKSSRILTAKEVAASGGVWAPTSAKRDKIAELKVALKEGQESLDDAATPEQIQDLYLADGLQLLAKIVDGVEDINTKEIQEFSEWLVDQQHRMPESIEKDKLEAHLSIVEEKINSMMANIAVDRYLSSVRDFYDPANLEEEGVEIDDISDPDLSCQDGAFAMSILWLRLQLTRSAIEHLKQSWDDMTTVCDGDVDRAAVTGELLDPQAPSISLAKIYAYLFAHMSGTCADRVDACWQLIDRDEDGLLEESEMNIVTQMCLVPVQSAFVNLFQETFDASVSETTIITTHNGEDSTDQQQTPAKQGWRQRRKQAKIRKAMLKLFQNTSKNHFEHEVEVNHRLRCIYAWAEKDHQDNKLDSVMVDADGWSGKKRYVELNPKISLPEFREVQQEHFTHLDRIGTEIVSSFREDLWVLQGRGRERQELMRDSTIYLAAVSVADYLILAS
jgi:hypothetical protein